jgi:hypothetical protein
LERVANNQKDELAWLFINEIAKGSKRDDEKAVQSLQEKFRSLSDSFEA